MTLREKIQAEIDAHQAEIDKLKAVLETFGQWAEKETSDVKAELESMIQRASAWF